MKKITRIISISLLGILSVAAVGVSAYLIATSVGQKEKVIKLKPFNWNRYGNEPKNFSQKNSFRVSFATSAPNSNGQFYVSQGTAWSFYIDSSLKDNINWYLLTNFHVVNDAVSYNGGFNYTNQNLWYQHNVKINNGFLLEDTSDDNGSQQYIPLVASNWQGGGKYPSISANANVRVITDNAKVADNNDDLNLFSNSTYSSSNYYNLDMSIIKITLSKREYNNHYSFFGQIANPYQNWLNDNSSLKEPNNSFTTYIAGNPGKEQQLVAQTIDPNNLEQTGYEYLRVSGDNQQSVARLKTLYFNSYITKNYFNGWLLSEGASGSAVYQLPNNISFPIASATDFNFLNAVPVGVYWGGASSTRDENLFKPCFIPFKTTRYNIFENFQSFLTSKYN